MLILLMSVRCVLLLVIVVVIVVVIMIGVLVVLSVDVVLLLFGLCIYKVIVDFDGCFLFFKRYGVIVVVDFLFEG